MGTSPRNRGSPSAQISRFQVCYYTSNKGLFSPPFFFFFKALAGARRSGFTAYNSWHKGSAAAAAEPKQEEAIFPPPGGTNGITAGNTADGEGKEASEH